MGQLALSMQNQSKDSFPSDTKKNTKDCMEINLSGRGLRKRKEENNEKTKKEEKEETGKESEQNNSELNEESREFIVWEEQPAEEGKLQKKEEVKVYLPPVPFP